MDIAPGVQLGPYEVVAPAGAGGMGQVYRANDTRLDRTVALKVLPAHLSSDPQFRERFDREARTISSLTHPHICTLYDVGHQDGVDYLVMEFVEGESLEERLTKGPLPIEQVLRYGIEIAEALDKAHRQGIVHRDLKPANIMLTKSGAKLLDFGLAKIVAAESPVAQLSHMATAQRQLTQEGTILGTFQYMAPEQLEGLEADARTDIFAFGAVLYEMATGRRAFEGKTKTSLIAAIVDRDPPPMSSIQPLTPPAFERVVKTCLAKDPDNRWQSARDVANELRWIQEAGSQAGVAAPIARQRKTLERIAWVLAIIASVAALVFGYFYWRASAEAPRVLQSSLLPPEKTSFAFRGPTGGFALSPDGNRIVFLVLSEGKTMLWLRPLNALTAQPLLGSEGAAFPFWSPDGRYVAFFAGAKLKKIDVNGGPPQVICDVGSQPRGGTWSKDGIILFTSNTREGVSKVAAAGGTPSAVTRLEKNEYSHRFPNFLPDGHHFLYVAQRTGAFAADRNTVYVGSLDNGERHALFGTSGAAVYSPPGYLVFPRESTLFAQRFDAGKRRLEGEAFPIVDKIQTFQNTLAAIFSLSQTGVLAYERAENITGLQLVWVDRSGKEKETVTPPGDYNHPSLSHDGKRIAYEQQDPGAGADIWVLDLTRRVPTRLTFEREDEISPAWSPDDSKIVYMAAQATGGFGIFRKASTGTTAAERLYEANGTVFPSQWTGDGAILFWGIEPKKNSFDIESFSVQNRTVTPLIASPFDDLTPQLSPDGRWLAYASNVSTQMEIYVEPYPPSGAKWQVSSSGGAMPRWRRDGKELFFRANDEKLMSVTIKTSAEGLEISTPSPLFQTHLRQALGFQYDVSADGQKFLLNAAKGGDDRTTVTLVTNWTAELKR